ncbi:hypothetical protein QR680_005828 [Steinernema hermaphroditum]|uniref:BTB domain-containing protein n=1 Tax=Steinernema hermaphroditum TaxID=289476 RepID=A0AA39HUV0_9BILA|nr:hypothetical protein QR680_005828 [Steinernema hermaphroditum]
MSAGSSGGARDSIAGIEPMDFKPVSMSKRFPISAALAAAVDKASLQSSPKESVEYCNSRHATLLLNNLNEFRVSDFLCDIEIEAEGRRFCAHRFVLAAAIPYFRSMFSCNMLESREPVIVIRDIPAAALEQLIEYAYTSKISINGDNVQQMLYAGSILQVDAVCEACQEFLVQYLSVANCLAIRKFADQHNCTKLIAAIDNFSMEHFRAISQCPEFTMISAKHLTALLKSSDLNVQNEQEVFETVIHWIEVNPAERAQFLVDLLSCVRLSQLPAPYLLNCVKVHPLIASDYHCRDLVSEAICEVLRTYDHLSTQFVCNPTTSGALIHSNSIASSFGYAPRPMATFCGDEDKMDAMTTSDWTPSRPRKSTAGVIFCVGGRGTAGDPFRSVEAYDWRKDHWVSVCPMNIRRRHVGVVSAEGKLYAIGGHNGTNHLDSAECFDPDCNVWTNVAPMNTPRRGIAVGTLGRAIYSVGGLDDSACFQTVERYDVESDKWTNVANMNVQRGGVGVASLEKYLYAVGGNDGTSSLDSCEQYDPLLNKWRLIASMMNRRAGAGVTVLDGFLYAIGGFDDNAPLSSCERYDPKTNKWGPIAPMSCPRGGVGVAAMGGRIYAIGGHDGIKYLCSVEAYDPVTNEWRPVSSISECRAGAGVTWANVPFHDSMAVLDPTGNVPNCV